MQVVRLKNELASGICCSMGIDAKPAGGVGTLSRAAEVLGGHGLSQVPFWFALSVQVQAFRGDFRPAFRFLFVQDKPILFFILPWSAMPPSLAPARYSSRSETRYGIESAAPLNSFIGAENRIIWLMCLPPSSA
jgi:hypothetical protein